MSSLSGPHCAPAAWGGWQERQEVPEQGMVQADCCSSRQPARTAFRNLATTGASSVPTVLKQSPYCFSCHDMEILVMHEGSEAAGTQPLAAMQELHHGVMTWS